MSTYNHTKRVHLYRAIIKRIGSYASHNWSGSGQKPDTYTNQQMKDFFVDIYEEVVHKFWKDGEKPPKSSEALHNQLKWAVSKQAPKTNGEASVQARNRTAAYEAGFMRMKDIIALEEAAEV